MDRIHTAHEMFPAADATAPIENSTSTGVPDAIQNACVQFSVRCIVPSDVSYNSCAEGNTASDIPSLPQILFLPGSRRLD